MSTEIIDAKRFNFQTILLVEDNEDDVFIMRSTFRKTGIPNPLQVVPDGEAAIAYLRGDGVYSEPEKYPLPAILLLDLNMPKKNGLEVLQWVRSQPHLKRLTVHILTASTRTVDVQRAYEYGANCYLVKPSKIEALVEMVRSWHQLAQFSAFSALTSRSTTIPAAPHLWKDDLPVSPAGTAAA